MPRSIDNGAFIGAAGCDGGLRRLLSEVQDLWAHKGRTTHQDE